MTDYVVSVAAALDSYRGDESEDRLTVLPSSEGWILGIADGVGGRSGGGVAADAAIQLVVAHARGVGGGQTDWSGFLVYVDAEVALVADGGETTFVVAEIYAGRIRGASAGDSEAWFVTEEGIVRLTQYQQRKPFVGSGDAAPMSFGLVVPSEGGTLIVASDGLFGYVSPDEICRIAHLAEMEVEDVVGQLVEAARGKSSGRFHDDIAVIVCRLPSPTLCIRDLAD